MGCRNPKETWTSCSGHVVVEGCGECSYCRDDVFGFLGAKPPVDPPIIGPFYDTETRELIGYAVAEEHSDE